MEQIMEYVLLAIPIVIGITAGINVKLKELFDISDKKVKELVTVLVSFGAVIYYVMFINGKDIPILIALFVAIYIGASGIYNVVKSKPIMIDEYEISDEVIELEIDDEQLEKELNGN